jgi:hypothetical protein
MTDPLPQNHTSKNWTAEPDHALVQAVKDGLNDAYQVLMERYQTFTLELASRLSFDDLSEVTRLSLLVHFDIWNNRSQIPASFLIPGKAFGPYIKHVVLQKYMKGPRLDSELKGMLLDLVKERSKG